MFFQLPSILGLKKKIQDQYWKLSHRPRGRRDGNDDSMDCTALRRILVKQLFRNLLKSEVQLCQLRWLGALKARCELASRCDFNHQTEKYLARRLWFHEIGSRICFPAGVRVRYGQCLGVRAKYDHQSK
jgi:hypothetical protein